MSIGDNFRAKHIIWSEKIMEENKKSIKQFVFCWHRDLAFLSNFKILHTLILDNNVSLNERTLPFLPSLRILWLNKCEISHLPKWMHQISICTPNIRQLSLMGNPGVRSTFNGGTSLDNNEYMWVLSFVS